MTKYILQITEAGNLYDNMTCYVVGSKLQRALYLFNEEVKKRIESSTTDFTEEEKEDYKEDVISIGGDYIDGAVDPDGEWGVYLFAAEDNESDPLQDFCNEEAPFRLQEIHNVPKEQITEQMIEDVAQIIRDSIDYNEVLYDDMDYDIREYLENNYKEEKK